MICVMIRCYVCSCVVVDDRHSVRVVGIDSIALFVENAFVVGIAIDAFVDSADWFDMALDIERDTVVEMIREVEVWADRIDMRVYHLIIFLLVRL